MKVAKLEAQFSVIVSDPVNTNMPKTQMQSTNRNESDNVVIQLIISPRAYVMTPWPNWCRPSSQKFKMPQTEFSVNSVSSSK
jgi:hypothetical protein